MKMQLHKMEEIKSGEANIEREKQRSESEARDIIHDLDRLYTFPEERKTRWVWELLQNAKDVADVDGVDIHFSLAPEYLEFKHNGLPFKTKHLLAILYKTSTKSLSGEGGTTGKYGTGFVTTHILNKKLTISGIHQNEIGKKRFTLEIDRSAVSFEENKALSAMQESIKKSFEAISNIADTTPEDINDNWHSFKYDLKPETYLYAEKGLLELERNLAFTLLINPKIKRVTIETPTGEKSYTANRQKTNIEGLQFISLGLNNGLLYQQSDKLIFGIPALKQVDSFRLLPIENQAILFKEFPLIGTENFNLPVFIQHKDFHPTEQRDGIRTKLISNDEDDPTANKNRKALTEFVNTYIPFMEKLISAGVMDKYLFAKSGLPDFVKNYSNIDWFQNNIQRPIREFIMQRSIVENCSGTFIEISKTKFILNDLVQNEEFYLLASKLIPEQIPIKSSIWEWSKIIEQDTEKWPENITLDIEGLVNQVIDKVSLDKDQSFEWLKQLYTFLEKNKLIHLGEKHKIYPNENGIFCLRDEVAIHPDIDNEFKVVALGLGKSLNDEFLNRKLGQVESIKPFDLNEFYNYLNKELISELKIEQATEVQIKAIFHICCLFRSERAFKRENWFNIINQLVPGLAPEKKLFSVEYEYYWRSAELWSIKYICYLIENAAKPTVFAQTYFQGHLDSCFAWLNEFLKYIFGLQDESKEVILKRHIIPNQKDDFKPYDDFIYAESDSKYFDETIKNIYSKYTERGDPRVSIIDTRISIDGIRKREVDILTKEIDKLFHDEHIESKVKKGGSLNELFMQLNDWFEKFSNADTLLTNFSNKRPSLYVLALGEGFSKQIMEIQSSGKSIEDIAELAKIKLSTQEMILFEIAATELGTNQLLAKAKEMIDAKQQIERWKTLGKAAETAFYEALCQTEPNFEILNPDIGKDFVIIANGKEYAIEIKSVDPYKGNVNMSLLQGKTAVNEKDRYSLCVMSRPEEDIAVDKNYFIKESRFVPNIGSQIGNSIDLWTQGLQNLDSNADVKVSLDDKIESVYISRSIWKAGITFDEFISILRLYFA
jgi:hypothetical protein